MARRKFFGGIHPKYHKELASTRAIETMPLPARLVVHFAQNLGAAPKPIVKKGDAVKKGQVIAEPQGFVSVPLHAPTSGTVQAIDVFPHPVGADMPAAVIIPDGKDEWAPGLDAERAVEGLDGEKIISIVRDAGLVGMGGASFPTHVKLSPPKEKKMDLLVVNGAECEDPQQVENGTAHQDQNSSRLEHHGWSECIPASGRDPPHFHVLSDD